MYFKAGVLIKLFLISAYQSSYHGGFSEFRLENCAIRMTVMVRFTPETLNRAPTLIPRTRLEFFFFICRPICVLDVDFLPISPKTTTNSFLKYIVCKILGSQEELVGKEFPLFHTKW